MKELEIKLKEIVSNVLESNTSMLSDSSGLLNHPNWDSINHVLIIVEIEIAFSIEFDDHELETSTTLGLLLNTIKTKLNF